MAPATTRLAELEDIIRRGFQTYIEVGKALEEIRESRLYFEQGFETFEDYLEQRWRMSRRAGYQYIAAATVAKNVNSSSQPSFTQARELALLPPRQQQQVAVALEAEGKAFEDISVREVQGIVQEVKAGANPSLAIHFASSSSEWFTPMEIIERVIKVLGGIDLDPCSNESKNVPAAKHFTQTDDGLACVWRGKIYLNPPYGRQIGAWVKKLCTEYGNGNVTEAIALIPARVDTDWFRLFRDFAVCFIDGRLRFSGHNNAAPFPSALVYCGQDITAFRFAFADIGDVWLRVRD